MKRALQYIGASITTLILLVMNNSDSGEQQYIDWGHAQPEGTATYFDQFLEFNKVPQDSFVFSYTQRVLQPIYAENSISFTVTETRKFPSKMTREKVEKAFIELFTSVSFKFEKEQKQFPFSFVPNSRSSSLSKEDIVGNAVSLFLSIHQLSLSEFKKNSNLEEDISAHEQAYIKPASAKELWSSVFYNLKLTDRKFSAFIDHLLEYSENENKISRILDDQRRFNLN